MAPKKNAVGTALRKSILDKNRKQLQQIHDACDHDFELQTVVLSTIENHNNAKIQSSTNNLLQALAAEKQQKKAAKQANETEVKDFDKPLEGTLRRGQLYYKRWGPELTLSVFQFCEPAAREWTLKEHPCIKQRGREVLEFVFGVRTGQTPDKVRTDNLTELTQRMKRLYIENGARLKLVTEGIETNTLSWAESGFYSVSASGTGKDAEVTITNRITKQKAVMPKNVVGDDAQSIAAAKISCNYSQMEACIATDVDTYILSNYFPSARRGLKRRLSADDTAIVANSTSGPAKKPRSLVAAVKAGALSSNSGLKNEDNADAEAKGSDDEK